MSAAAMLFTDEQGRILLVERNWNKALVLPGGVIEPGESPEDAAAREVREELGVVRSVGRLLTHDRRAGKDHFIFEGGTIPNAIEMAPDYGGEVAALHVLTPRQAIEQHAVDGQARLAAAIDALKADAPIVLS